MVNRVSQQMPTTKNRIEGKKETVSPSQTRQKKSPEQTDFDLQFEMSEMGMMLSPIQNATPKVGGQGTESGELQRSEGLSKKGKTDGLAETLDPSSMDLDTSEELKAFMAALQAGTQPGPEGVDSRGSDTVGKSAQNLKTLEGLQRHLQAENLGATGNSGETLSSLQQAMTEGGGENLVALNGNPKTANGQFELNRKTWNKNLSGKEFMDLMGSVKPNVDPAGGKGVEGSKGDAIVNELAEAVTAGSGSKMIRDLKEQLTAHGKNEVVGDSPVIQTAQMNQADSVKTQTLPDVSASVASGGMARPRISTDGLMGLSTQIQKLSSQGGGEFRVRLKPDNLGELHLRVFTNGTGVGLQIHASDEKAKKIIEESIGHLKESMSAQSLTLNQVDLSVVGSPTVARNDETTGRFQDSLNQNQNQNAGFNSNPNGNSNTNRQHSGSNPGLSGGFGQMPRKPSGVIPSLGGARASSSRLDVMA